MIPNNPHIVLDARSRRGELWKGTKSQVAMLLYAIGGSSTLKAHLA